MLKLLNVKTLLLLLIASFGSVIFSGCASTDRMKRLSPWQKDINKTIDGKDVNLWPAYYNDSNGTAILWPMVDIDKQGFGIRPFYNQDGDRYSILFPLSGWNTEKGDGWALNSYWGRNYWGSFPLTHVSDYFSYVIPFYWDNKDFEYNGVAPLYHYSSTDKRFHFNMMAAILAQYSYEYKANYGKKAKGTSYSIDKNELQKQHYRFLTAFYVKNFNSVSHGFLPLYFSSAGKKDNTFVSPLFVYNKDINDKSTRTSIFTPLYGQEWNDERVLWRSVLGPAFVYTNVKKDKYGVDLMWPLMAYDYETGDQQKLKKDSLKWRIFPLFSWNYEYCPTLLNIQKDSYAFFNIFGYRHQEQKNGGYNNNWLLTNYFNKTIYYDNAMISSHSSCKDLSKDYYSRNILGKKFFSSNIDDTEYGSIPLFWGNSKEVKYLIGKKDKPNSEYYNHKLVNFGETIYKIIRSESSKKVQEKLTELAKRTKKSVVEQQKRVKELKIIIAKLKEYQQKFNQLSKELNFDYEIPVTRKQSSAILKDLGMKQSVTATHNKFTSLFYSQESFANNYEWDVLWFLARGKRNDKFEGISVFEYLYRYERAGEKVKRSMFPGISYYNNPTEKNKRFSFLWRVLNIETKNDKTSGHIFFVPFGNK